METVLGRQMHVSRGLPADRVGAEGGRGRVSDAECPAALPATHPGSPRGDSEPVCAAGGGPTTQLLSPGFSDPRGFIREPGDLGIRQP